MKHLWRPRFDRTRAVQAVSGAAARETVVICGEGVRLRSELALQIEEVDCPWCRYLAPRGHFTDYDATCVLDLSSTCHTGGFCFGSRFRGFRVAYAPRIRLEACDRPFSPIYRHF